MLGLWVGEAAMKFQATIKLRLKQGYHYGEPGVPAEVLIWMGMCRMGFRPSVACRITGPR